MIINFKLVFIATAVAFTTGSVSGVYLTNKYKNNVFDGRIIEQEREATRILNEEREKNRQVEIQLSQIKDQLEIEHVNSTKKIKALNNKYTAAVDAGKRLRDPYARSGCENGSTGNSKSSTKSTNGRGTGALSAEASRFLLDEASRADQVVIDLALCKSWVKEVQKTLNKKP